MMKSHSKKELRPYQIECLKSIPNKGSYLIQMATGTGKTFTFSKIPRKGNMLILSHRQELVEQPIKYFNEPVGIEIGSKTSNGEPIISASVLSLKNRYKKFPRNYFDLIITDEAHHAAAESYQILYKYFKPRLHLGFTATPNRHDKIGLFPTFSRVIFEYPIRQAIEDGYLCDINCILAKVEVDFNSIRSRAGDFVTEDLGEEMAKENNVKSIAEAYEKYAKGQTLIFAVNTDHAKAIADKIPGSKVVLGSTPKEERRQIIEDFKNGKIQVLVNCMVLTEGTDIPNIETVIMARPTQSEGLYQQMVGRGTRLYPGKDKLNLIDLVGVSTCRKLCTAPVLIGLDPTIVPDAYRDNIQGDLLNLEEKIKDNSDVFDNWIRSAELVDIWAKEMDIDTHSINFTRMPDGSLTVLGHTVPAPNALGGHSIQDYIDRIYSHLCTFHQGEEMLWNGYKTRYWKNDPATDKQKWLANKLTKRKYWNEIDKLNKLQASQLISRFKG